MVLLENTSYNTIMGASSSMPHLKSLALKYAYSSNYYANTHPSIGNYFMLTTGQIITNDDGYSASVSVDNLARRLPAAA